MIPYPDVCNDADIEKAGKITEDNLGHLGLNLLINNAGMSYKKQYIGNLDRQQLMDQFNVNVISAMLITQVRWSRYGPVQC